MICGVVWGGSGLKALGQGGGRFQAALTSRWGFRASGLVVLSLKVEGLGMRVSGLTV